MTSEESLASENDLRMAQGHKGYEIEAEAPTSELE